MLRGMAGGLGLLLIVVGGILLGQGVGLIGGSFMTGPGRWAVTGGVMIAIGICLLAAARYRDPIRKNLCRKDYSGPIRHSDENG